MSASLTSHSPSARRVDAEQPWLGLAHYSESEHEFFFGRDEQVTRLYNCVSNSPLTILHGPSGRGKSSIIGAGLIHRLKSAGHAVTLLRRDYHLLQEGSLVDQVLALACGEPHITASIPALDRTLWQFFHDRSRPWNIADTSVVELPPPILIFDQFEEVFSRGEDHPTDRRSKARAKKFLSQLADLVENRAPASLRRRINRASREERKALLEKYDFSNNPLRVVLVVRADFLSRLERLRGQMPSLMHQRIELLELSGDQAYDAVFMPGTKRSGKPPIVSAEIAAQIVCAAANVPPNTPLREISGVSASILSLICEELNEARRQRTGPPESVTEFTPQASHLILRQFYEKKMAAHQKIRSVLEERLAPTGTRETPTLQSLLAELRHVPDARKQIVEDLANERILVVEHGQRAERVEFTHDKLAEIAKSSADARRAGERFRRRFKWAATLAVFTVAIAVWTGLQAKAVKDANVKLEEQRDKILQHLKELGKGANVASNQTDSMGVTWQNIEKIVAVFGFGDQNKNLDVTRLRANAHQAIGYAALTGSSRSIPDAISRFQKEHGLRKTLLEDQSTDRTALLEMGVCCEWLAEAHKYSADSKEDFIRFTKDAIGIYEQMLKFNARDWDIIEEKGLELRKLHEFYRLERRWKECQDAYDQAKGYYLALLDSVKESTPAPANPPPSADVVEKWSMGLGITILQQIAAGVEQAEALSQSASDPELSVLNGAIEQGLGLARDHLQKLLPNPSSEAFANHGIGMTHYWEARFKELSASKDQNEIAQLYQNAASEIAKVSSKWRMTPAWQSDLMNLSLLASQAWLKIDNPTALIEGRRHAFNYVSQLVAQYNLNPNDHQQAAATARGYEYLADVDLRLKDRPTSVSGRKMALAIWTNLLALAEAPPQGAEWRLAAIETAKKAAAEYEHLGSFKEAEATWVNAVDLANGIKDEKAMTSSLSLLRSRLGASRLLQTLYTRCLDASSSFHAQGFFTDANLVNEATQKLQLARQTLDELLTVDPALRPSVWRSFAMNVLWHEAFLAFYAEINPKRAEQLCDEGLKIAEEISGDVPAYFSATKSGLEDLKRKCQASPPPVPAAR